MVEIRHRNGIVTRYAHLNSIEGGIRAGRAVSQGTVIGRVGSTGTSTAPHLHYEFRVNGVARDPRSMKFEAGEPLDRADRPGFELERDLLQQLLGRPMAQGTATPLTD
jgi:murein DD-endopeptidase MepM/ murein hydrolase activator NlpD